LIKAKKPQLSSVPHEKRFSWGKEGRKQTKKKTVREKDDETALL